MNNKKIIYKNPIQIVFGGCGGLYSYYMGFVHVLQQYIDFKNIIFSGTSAGSFIGLCCALDLNMEYIFKYHNMQILEKLEQTYTGPYFNWYNIYYSQILSFLKKDDYKKLNNRFSYSITEFPSLKNKIIYQWDSNEDLVNGLIASGYIPIYGTSLFKTYRNKYCIDGSISNKKPLLYNNIPHISITIDKYRKFNKIDYLIISNKDFHYKLFNYGMKDALDNIKDFL